MTETSKDLTATTTRALSTRVAGQVYTPDTGGYDTARTGFQLRTAHRPDIVVAAANTRDVAAAAEFAAARRTPLAVQASGHGLNTPMEGGVLLSTAALSDVRVDPRARTAWVESGARWRHVIEAAGHYGLAPLSGSFPGLGAVSYTLGGGIGLLARRYGFAADHVRRIDMVDVNGKSHRVTAASDPELFWGLRGGGGNFGIVTGMEIELFPVASIYGGSLFFDVTRSPDVLGAWQQWTASVPEEMTSAVSMLPFPDVTGVPEPLRGRHVAQLQISYAGTPTDGEQVVRPLRELGPCLRDTLRERPFTESGAVFDEPDQPHAYLSDNKLLAELDPEAVRRLPETAGPAVHRMCVVQLRHLGGALHRPPDVANCVSHRQAKYSVGVLSPVQQGEEFTVRATHRDVLAPFAARTVGRSLNFSFGPLGTEQVRAGFDVASYQRLVELKSSCDPGNVLACNAPIPPE